MKHLLPLLLILSLHSCSQKPASEAVQADPAFNCTTTFIETDCQLDTICNSRNDIEIRLEVSYEPASSFALYVLAYHYNRWTLARYSRSYEPRDSTITIDSVTSPQRIAMLVDTLQQNGVFTLPDQEALDVSSQVDDGERYQLSFKKGNQYRSYGFNNPGIFMEDHKEVKEFKHYAAIAAAFYNIFDQH